MKKALIITYYWPPSGGAGVQRWLKMTKYFRDFGVEPVIYTAENPDMAIQDFSLVKEIPDDIQVITYPVWEPYGIYRKLLGKKKTESVNQGFISENKKSGLLEKFSIWVRGNFFIPDARKFWITPSIQFLRKYLAEHPVDIIISTGPPHSMHMIALGLKKYAGLPWIADFRDPWTHIDFYDQLQLTQWADRKHHAMEQQVLQHADSVVTVSRSWAEDFEKLGRKNVQVITNGFDEADFPKQHAELYSGFVLHHIGSMNKDRNPHVLWKVLKELCKEDPDFKNALIIKLTGKNDFAVMQSIAENGLKNNLELVEYMPHAEIVKQVPMSTILLLPLNDTPNVAGVIPGKLFEYLAANRPILCIGDVNGDAANIIAECKAGFTCDFKNAAEMKNVLRKLFEQYKNNTLHVAGVNTENYTRKKGAQQFAEIIYRLAGSELPA